MGWMRRHASGAEKEFDCGSRNGNVMVWMILDRSVIDDTLDASIMYV